MIEVVAPGPGGGFHQLSGLQDRWAQVVHAQAARVGASAGLITRRLGPYGFEEVLYPDWPPDTVLQLPGWAPGSAMIGEARNVLYRYAWVTIIPPELAANLGGADGLAATEAFCDVNELPNGSLWLRATHTLGAFTQDRVDSVAAALARVLVPDR